MSEAIITAADEPATKGNRQEQQAWLQYYHQQAWLQYYRQQAWLQY
jgi:hypothetical protein